MRSARVVRSCFVVLCAWLTASAAIAQTDPQEIYFIPDVARQFNELALRPEPFAFRGFDNFDPTFLDYHYQGIVRKHGPGTPYLFVARNSDGAGYLAVVRMGSRDRNGERLRTNRLLHGYENGATLPDVRDTTVAVVRFDGANGWPAYKHPGGMQQIGNILAVPLSQPLGDFPSLRMVFIDISNPAAPGITSSFDPDPRGSSEFGVGQVALTPVQNPEGPGVRYLMLLAGESNRDVRLYRSLPTNDRDHSSDLASPLLKWQEIGQWTGDELDDPGADTWPCCGSKSHQMFSFVREQSLEGQLFLVGAFNDRPAIEPGGGRDFLDLYRVHVDRYGNPAERVLSHVERKHVTTDSIAGDTSHFAGSTGVYVSPSGELIVYATEHTNQGQSDQNGWKTIRAGEWRHREIVRPDSPTLRPRVEGPSFYVDEGGSRTLVGSGRPPITRAWLQLFMDDGLGLTDEHFNTEVVFDYDDRAKDDYDNIPRLFPWFNDTASSWRWFAPPGCTIRVYQHSADDSDFPGRYKALVGTGVVEQDPNLDDVQSDNAPGSMNDMLSAMDFACGDYYTAPITVSWDLDRNGSFETIGETALISAADFDGPSTVSIPVRAQLSSDTTPLGTSAPHTVDLHVLNVAPIVTSFALMDSLGGAVGVDVPFGVVGAEYSAVGSFTDPGRLDRQTAQIEWGDGSVDDSRTFRIFTDAFGGATGQLAQGHIFQAAGTFTIGLEVIDHDEDVGAVNVSVEMVAPAAAIARVVAEIDALLATATDTQQRKYLESARRALAGGSEGTSNNGALDKLASGETSAAITKVREAIDDLRRAQENGADVGVLIALLEQIARALAAA